MKYIIFDLSEVIILGLHNVEYELANFINDTPQNIDKYLKQNFIELMCGNITEDQYLDSIFKETKWNISRSKLKEIIRKNFHNEIEGTKDIIIELKKNYNLVLLSDHVKEWVSYILENNKFLDIFDKKYFSYELGYIKKNKESFKKVLSDLEVNSEDVLFIDDSATNIEVAKTVGIKGILFRDAYQLKEELTKMNII